MRVDVPSEATTVRLVRIVGDDLREYQAMECSSGASGLRRLFAQQLVRPIDPAEEYGLADLLDGDDSIVGEVPLNREQFRRLAKKLRCRVVSRGG